MLRVLLVAIAVCIARGDDCATKKAAATAACPGGTLEGKWPTKDTKLSQVEGVYNDGKKCAHKVYEAQTACKSDTKISGYRDCLNAMGLNAHPGPAGKLKTDKALNELLCVPNKDGWKPCKVDCGSPAPAPKSPAPGPSPSPKPKAASGKSGNTTSSGNSTATKASTSKAALRDIGVMTSLMVPVMQFWMAAV